MDLIAGLVCARESRLSSKRYRSREAASAHSLTSRSRLRSRESGGRGRSVYPHDAEDIKGHKWFRDTPWDQLHLVTPPFVPRIASADDTHYFDEEEPISDWSESCSEDNDTESDDLEPPPALEANPLAAHPPTVPGDTTTQSPFASPIPPPNLGVAHNAHPSTVIRRNPQKIAAIQEQLATFPRHTRTVLAQFIATPYDSARLKHMDREILALVASTASGSTLSSVAPQQQQQQQQSHEAALVDQMKAFVRTFGRRERKRPRDRLLRDRNTKATVLRVRKDTAFLGYTFRSVIDADVVTAPRFDGAERMSAAPSVYFHGGMPSITEYGEGMAMPAMGMGVGTEMGMAGDWRGGLVVGPGEPVHMAAYRALHHHDQRPVNMGW